MRKSSAPTTVTSAGGRGAPAEGAAAGAHAETARSTRGAPSIENMYRIQKLQVMSDDASSSTPRSADWMDSALITSGVARRVYLTPTEQFRSSHDLRRTHPMALFGVRVQRSHTLF